MGCYVGCVKGRVWAAARGGRGDGGLGRDDGEVSRKNVVNEALHSPSETGCGDEKRKEGESRVCHLYEQPLSRVVGTFTGLENV